MCITSSRFSLASNRQENHRDKKFKMLATLFFEMCARSTVIMNIGYQSFVCVRACVRVCTIHNKLELGPPMSVELHW